MGELTINKQTFKELKKAYNSALKDGKEVFIFQGKEILTSYAKYMIEYIGAQLK